MKILVFDDKAIHLDAAKAQLGKEHDLTVVDSYDEARKLLRPHVDEDRAKEIFATKFGDDDPNKSEGITKEVRSERLDFYYGEAKKQATIYPDFDAVLVDLLVPASGKEQGGPGTRFIGQEMPVGIFIALLAAKNGAKYVAVFTDSSHHHHPASACFDAFNKGEMSPTPFTVNGAKVILSNTRNWVNHFDPNDLTKEVDLYEVIPSSGSYNDREREGLASGKIVIAKNWAKLLYYLLNDKNLKDDEE
jgi:hypothetical protein